MHTFGTLLFALGILITVPSCVLAVAAPGAAAGIILGLVLIVVGLLMRIASKPQAADPALAIPSPKTHMRCPDCAEFVLREARVCKHCGRSLAPAGQQQGRIGGA